MIKGWVSAVPIALSVSIFDVPYDQAGLSYLASDDDETPDDKQENLRMEGKLRNSRQNMYFSSCLLIGSEDKSWL